MREQHYTYARFWKCALQVNSHRYSSDYRGQDHGMDASAYAELLRDICLEEAIQVVGLADHGSVEESETVRQVLSAAGIVVFPGFEVATTEKIHWVCLFREDTSEQKLEPVPRENAFDGPGRRGAALGFGWAATARNRGRTWWILLRSACDWEQWAAQWKIQQPLEGRPAESSSDPWKD